MRVFGRILLSFGFVLILKTIGITLLNWQFWALFVIMIGFELINE